MILWDEAWNWALGYCGPEVNIGNHCTFTLPHKLILREKVRIDPGVLITSGMVCHGENHICTGVWVNGGEDAVFTMGTGSFVGAHAKILNASDDYRHLVGPWSGNPMLRGNITFSAHSGVAVNVVVLPGVVLPEGCTIGANSLVSPRDALEPWTTYAGGNMGPDGKRSPLVKLYDRTEARKESHA